MFALLKGGFGNIWTHPKTRKQRQQMVELSIDFETTSTADLRKVGAYRYSVHPDTKVLCMSYSFDDGKTVKNWRPGEELPWEAIGHAMNGGIVRGWNVGFEYHIWNNVLSRLVRKRPLYGQEWEWPLEISQLRDTMAQAAYWGLPLSLDAAAPAAGLATVKDKTGHALMMRMARPRTNKKGVQTWWHETDAQKYADLIDYCDQDVRTECAVAAAIPALPDAEQEMWEMDLRIT